MQGLQQILNAAGRDKILLRVTAFCWLMAKLIGWRMFTTYRLFPTAPVFDSLNHIPAAVQTIFFTLSFFLLLGILVTPRNKSFLLVLLIIEVASSLLDQNRIQPWDYQYMFILFIFLAANAAKKDVNTRLGLVMVSIYVYGGLSKLNLGFLQGIWGQMLLGQFFHIHPQSPLLHSWLLLGYFIPAFEIANGIGLIFTKTRKVSATLLIAMHVFILVFLGPAGLKYNMVIWPWNVAMIAYLYLVFFEPDEKVSQPKALLSGAGIIVSLCWVLLPALSFAGLWDNYLSSAIYSGRLPQMVICVKDTSQCRPLQHYCVQRRNDGCSGQSFINLQYWAMAETKMAPYPEIRAYKEIAGKLQKEYPAAGFSFIYYPDGQTMK